MHGVIRPALFQHWKEDDVDIQVYEKLPEWISYHDMMRKSKFCICPSGHKVASPRIVKAIYAEFSVSEIPKLKEILMVTSEDEYPGLVSML
ncbi:hypothetical protein FEM48_Zijuj04G0142100 [Ziziphus jujuba var. spinosa]|uniref:Exostosin GT47 domain-containing protein n=1 Tax=Ziziphus jujuba var. spinosa TaxID=714518 RepID=A0A978VKC4_ZIZJJ|nr:hypothetical protein FEM48_Zijuj04G0142100 [Ziziphus jujuba var. spinosa]